MKKNSAGDGAAGFVAPETTLLCEQKGRESGGRVARPGVLADVAWFLSSLWRGELLGVFMATFFNDFFSEPWGVMRG
jgi:hypothetical protein